MSLQCSLPNGSARCSARPDAARLIAKHHSIGRSSSIRSIRPLISLLGRSSHKATITLIPSSRASRCLIACSALPSAQPGKTTLGFVGVGIMGLAMCHNLIKAGYEVVVWNRNTAKCEPLVSAGAKLATSAKDVAQKATYVFGMVSDPAAALAVATGSDGVAAGLSAGKGYVDVSTVDSATSAKVAEAVRASGAAFLEAPVSGSKAPAEQGKLIFLTAGDKALFDAVGGPLDAMGKAKFFLGDVGAGANMKLVVNMMLGTVMASFAEGLALADKVGLKETDVVEVLGLGALASPMLAGKGPSMVARKYPTAFPLKHQQKDLRLALELAKSRGQALPVAAAANSLYVDASKAGQADADFSAVLEAVLKAKSG